LEDRRASAQQSRSDSTVVTEQDGSGANLPPIVFACVLTECVAQRPRPTAYGPQPAAESPQSG